MKDITKLSQMSKIRQVIFKKMFDMVQAPHDLELIGDWYHKYSWTEAREEEFKEWFVDYLYNSNEARKDFGLRKNKKSIRKTFMWFVLMWGWKIREESCDTN